MAISVDEMGMIEYWSGTKTGFEFPVNIDWEYKTDTDLYEFLKVDNFNLFIFLDVFADEYSHISHC